MLLRRSRRHGEGARNPAAGLARHHMTVRPARGAATVAGRPARIKVDQHPPARQAVLALAHFAIADPRYHPPHWVLDAHMSLSSVDALTQVSRVRQTWVLTYQH